MEDKKPPMNVMFYCGGQLDGDDNLLPNSFTVFPNTVPFRLAIEIIIMKIGQDLVELNISNSEGSAALLGIANWQEFADIKIDDHIKMVALMKASMTTLGELLSPANDELGSFVHQMWPSETE
jgi:hypothetical protein